MKSVKEIARILLKSFTHFLSILYFLKNNSFSVISHAWVFYLHVCLVPCVYSVYGGQKRVPVSCKLSYRWLWEPQYGCLESKHGFPRRVSSSLKHWPISLVPLCLFYFKLKGKHLFKKFSFYKNIYLYAHKHFFLLIRLSVIGTLVYVAVLFNIS